MPCGSYRTGRLLLSQRRPGTTRRRQKPQRADLTRPDRFPRTDKKLQLAPQASTPRGFIVRRTFIDDAEQIPPEPIAHSEQHVAHTFHVAQCLLTFAGADIEIQAAWRKIDLRHVIEDCTLCEPERRTHHTGKSEYAGLAEERVDADQSTHG